MEKPTGSRVIPWAWFSGLAALLLGRMSQLGREVRKIATTIDQLMSTLTDLQTAQGQLVSDLSTVEQLLKASNQNPSVDLDPALALVQGMLSNAQAVHQGLAAATSNPPTPAPAPAPDTGPPAAPAP